MSKIKKSDLLNLLQEQAEMIFELSGMIKLNKISIIKLENEREKPQLKQLDQSVFDGLDEKWRFAAVDKSGKAWVYSGKPERDIGYWFVVELVGMSIGEGFDASDWQNSLIERDTAKDLLEVESELTGSDLARAMLARGDTRIICDVDDGKYELIVAHDGKSFIDADGMRCPYVTPINNQGEPLTAKDVGL